MLLMIEAPLTKRLFFSSFLLLFLSIQFELLFSTTISSTLSNRKFPVLAPKRTGTLPNSKVNRKAVRIPPITNKIPSVPLLMNKYMAKQASKTTFNRWASKICFLSGIGLKVTLYLLVAVGNRFLTFLRAFSRENRKSAKDISMATTNKTIFRKIC